MPMEQGDISVDVSGEVQGVAGAKVVRIAQFTINNYPNQAPEAERAKSKAKAGENPYKGLAHFGPNDHQLFFGRDDVVEVLKKSVTRNRFTAVLGPSGSGKSSVVLAGLAPALAAEGNWLFSYFRVSDSMAKNPYQALTQGLAALYDPQADKSDQQAQAKKLANYLQNGELSLTDICDAIRKSYPGKRPLLIADQFEELYTTGIAANIQQHFTDLLIQLGDIANAGSETSVSLLITMRADFLAIAATHARFAKMLDQHTHIIGPMERDQLRTAIEEPARNAGVIFEQGLVDTIIDDIEGAYANLPLLEFALSRIWPLQQDQCIRLADYQSIGRAMGALMQRAQSIYDQLSSEQQQGAQRVFTLLVKTGLGTEDTRRIALRQEFLPQDWTLAQQLADEEQRLIVTNRNAEGMDTAEVVHEALIRHWPTLRAWIDRDRQFLIWREDLRQLLAQWEKHDRNDDALLRGITLRVAEEWQSNQADRLTEKEQAFIQQSLQLRRDEAERLRQSLLEVEEERNKALIAQSRFLAELSRQQTEQGCLRISALLAFAALPSTNSQRPFVPKAQVSLSLTLGQNFERVILRGHEKAVNHATFSPDGSLLATTSGDGTARLWDARSGAVVAVLKGHDETFIQAVFSPDGSQLVTASWDGTARLWDARSGAAVAVLKGHEETVFNAAFSPDGAQLVTASEDGTARLWDARSGAAVAVFKGHDKAVIHADFSPDGAQLVTASRDGTARLWDAQSGAVVAVLKGHEDTVYHAAFSPGGSQLVTTSGDGTARLWDARNGAVVAVLKGHEETFFNAVFSPDGAQLVTASRDGTARLWDARSSAAVVVLWGHEDTVYHAAFGPDGSQLVTASGDGTARLWDARSGAVVAVLKGHDKAVIHAAFSPDRSHLMTASEDGTAWLWDARSGTVVAVLKGHEEAVYHAAFSPDGSRVVTASKDGTARLWPVFRGPKDYAAYAKLLDLPPLTEDERRRFYLE